jgi:nicotinamidase-related amidase
MSTVLLVIDVQQGVVNGAVDREGVIGRINQLIDQAREKNVPIIFVQHHDEGLTRESDAWGIVPELHRQLGDPVIEKNYRDAFAGTEMLDTLQALGATHLVITGAQSDYCVTTASHSALVHGFDVTLVTDAHTTVDAPLPNSIMGGAQIIEYFNDHFSSLVYPGRRVEALKADAVVF